MDQKSLNKRFTDLPFGILFYIQIDNYTLSLQVYFSTVEGTCF